MSTRIPRVYINTLNGKSVDPNRNTYVSPSSSTFCAFLHSLSSVRIVAFLNLRQLSSFSTRFRIFREVPYYRFGLSVRMSDRRVSRMRRALSLGRFFAPILLTEGKYGSIMVVAIDLEVSLSTAGVSWVGRTSQKMRSLVSKILPSEGYWLSLGGAIPCR